MTEEKIIDTSQKENQPQDKTDKERLTEEQLDKVAGGLGGFAIISLMKYIVDLNKKDISGEFMHDPGDRKDYGETSGK